MRVGAKGDYGISGVADDGNGRGPRRRYRGNGDSKGQRSLSANGQLLGILHVDGEREPVHATLVMSSVLTQDLRDTRVTAHRLIVFGQHGRQYTINYKTFDHMRVDTRVPLGNIEDWTIRNDTDDMHVFHIQQVNFQVIELNGVRQKFNARVDTVRVLPRQSVMVRIPFTNPLILGRFMYHCHVLEHEDRGMMAQIEVYDPRQQQAHHALRVKP